MILEETLSDSIVTVSCDTLSMMKVLSASWSVSLIVYTN